MPYLTDCDYKKFEPNEYHISRIVDFFVLIFMLRGSLHFIEDDVSVSVQEGEWYIQRKNLLQNADRPSPGAEYYYFHFKADYTQDLRKKFAILDAGMTDLIRPALYQAFHKMENITSEEPLEAYDVVGPICESSDVFGKAIDLNKVKRGDLIALRSAGAYGEIMASGYNCRELPKGYTSDELV